MLKLMRLRGAIPDIARGAHDPPRPCLNRKRKTVAAAVPAAIAGDTPATTENQSRLGFTRFNLTNGIAL